MIKTTTEGDQAIKSELQNMLKQFNLPYVLVGIHSDSTDPPEGQINMATLGAVHEFGAEIKHPGGTAYGYATKDDAENGRVRFLKKGAGYMVLGETKPHTIKIPARPWLKPGFETGLKEYQGIMEEAIIAASEGEDPTDILERMGVIAVGKVQQYMTNLKSPPNAPSTVRRKKSSNPLIDEGIMRSSVNYKISMQKPKEGIN